MTSQDGIANLVVKTISEIELERTCKTSHDQRDAEEKSTSSHFDVR